MFLICLYLFVYLLILNKIRINFFIKYELVFTDYETNVLYLELSISCVGNMELEPNLVTNGTIQFCGETDKFLLELEEWVGIEKAPKN